MATNVASRNIMRTGIFPGQVSRQVAYDRTATLASSHLMHGSGNGEPGQATHINPPIDRGGLPAREGDGGGMFSALGQPDRDQGGLQSEDVVQGVS